MILENVVNYVCICPFMVCCVAFFVLNKANVQIILWGDRSYGPMDLIVSLWYNHPCYASFVQCLGLCYVD